MANTHIHFTVPFEPVDAADVNRKWQVILGVSGNAARFPGSTVITNPCSAKFVKGSYISNYGDASVFSFSGTFTVAFYAKFDSGAITDEVYPNLFACVFDKDNILSIPVPATITVTDWNFYNIIRNSKNEVFLKINGKTVAQSTAAITVPFNISNGSSIFLGNLNRWSTGYTVNMDDILIFNKPIWEDDFTVLPTDYFDLSTLRYCLVIEVATGNVYGRV